GLTALTSAAHLAGVHTLELPATRLAQGGIDLLARSALALRRLQIERAGLVGEAVAPLTHAAFANALQQLRIHHNRLGDGGARLVAAGFPALELLDLDSTELRASGARAVLSSPALARLTSLDVSRNSLGAELVPALDALALPALRHLACVQNAVVPAIAEAFAGAPLPELRSLDLSDNALADDGLVALARTTGLPKLEMLRIKNTGVGSRGLAALGASPLGARLRAIDLARNEIDDPGVAALLANDLRALDALDLAGSALTARGVRTLVESPLAARLKHLTITGLGAGALDVLFAAHLPELRSLVADCFDDDAARLLARARGLPALHSIVFTARALTDAGARALAGAPGLTHVLWLELDALAVSDAGRAQLRGRFAHHVAVYAGGSLQAFGALARRV
ncbi:MAG TPA: hypothetical protein VK427_17945, partial [Kofleriaceae bacterium]|nr:hypothetical protein [Kofleriaceae bacterium]